MIDIVRVFYFDFDFFSFSFQEDHVCFVLQKKVGLFALFERNYKDGNWGNLFEKRTLLLMTMLPFITNIFLLCKRSQVDLYSVHIPIMPFVIFN